VKAVYEKPVEKSIISSVLSNEKVPAYDKGLKRLKHELHFLMLAGTDAPSQALAVTMFHLLWNPEPYKKLKEELDEAFPVLADADWNKLKSLPYLVSYHQSCHAHVLY
jgi:cytochrome P450